MSLFTAPIRCFALGAQGWTEPRQVFLHVFGQQVASARNVFVLAVAGRQGASQGAALRRDQRRILRYGLSKLRENLVFLSASYLA